MPTDQIVVIPAKCAKCSRQIEIDCEHSPGFGYMNFYAVDCPHCHARIRPQLPGNIVDVRKVVGR